MDFKSMLTQLSQLSEATKETPTGKIHKAEPGGYGRKVDPADDEGDEKKTDKPAVKRGRGRPKKGADSETGQVAKYDNAKNLQSFMVGNIPKKGLPGKPGKKHTLKDWIEQVEAKYIAETAPGQQLTVKPMPGAAQLVDPATQKVMATGDAASVKNIQGAVAQGKVQMRGSEEMAEGDEDYSAKKARAGKDIGKPGKQFGKIAKSAAERYGSKERGEKVAGAVLAKLRQKTNEADIPSDQSDMGAGLGAGRSQTTLEAKRKSVKENAKPDFLDVDKDGNEKESFKDAVDDSKEKKDKKKKVNESVHKHTAARLLGKHHALAKEAYNCKYEDMEEAKCYHDGYKEGLDECYGQMPVQGLVGEMNSIPATTPGMASAAMPSSMEEDMFDEGNAFTAALARTPQGGQFKVGDKTFTDSSGYDDELDEMMTFENWDKELNNLLNEGMTVSISKGQQGAPDSVSVTAQDAEADQLLSVIKSAGLGLFGGEEHPQQGFAPEVTGMSAAGEEEGRDTAEIGVVDDHDGMMELIKKVVGGEQQPEEVGAHSDEGHDYESEEDHDHGEEGHEHKEVCDACGQSECECDDEGHEDEDKDPVDETESYDQEEYEVAEDNAPDSDEAETSADEETEADEDNALAKADELNEWANEAGKKGTEESFETDIAFITRVIAGGLNKEKATGQTTIPVIPGQNDRMGYSATNESILDWKKLAGLK